MIRSTPLFFLAAALAAGCTQGPPSAPDAPAVRVEEVRPHEVALGTTHLAIVRSRDGADVRPQVVGVIESIDVRSGAVVEAGDVLMRIDRRRQAASVQGARAATSLAQASLERAGADLATLEAEHQSALAAVEFAEQEQARFESLFQAGGAPLQQRERTATELDRANAALRAVEARINAQRSAIEGLEAAVRQSSSNVRAGEAELSYYTVVAPVAGRLGDIPVHVGDLVNPQTVLTTVEGSAQLEIYVQVPAHELDRLEVGLPVEVLGPGGARLDETQLTFVAPRVDPRTQTILAKAPVEGPGLLSGRFVDARIVWERKAVPTVPPSAVIRVNDQPFVYVLGEESTVTQRPVRLGPLAEQRYVVEEGLREGERVVSAGILRLRDGAHVSIEQAPGNATAQRE